MQLREYLFRNFMTLAEFARQIDYDERYMGRINRGEVKPGLPLARKIEKVTHGVVTIEDMMTVPPITARRFRIKKKELGKKQAEEYEEKDSCQKAVKDSAG